MNNWNKKDDKMKNSSDVWFIAFLMHKGHSIDKYDVIDRGRVRCYFNLTDEEWQQYKLEFNNSEIIKFKSLIDQLKDLAYVMIFFIGLY